MSGFKLKNIINIINFLFVSFFCHNLCLQLKANLAIDIPESFFDNSLCFQTKKHENIPLAQFLLKIEPFNVPEKEGEQKLEEKYGFNLSLYEDTQLCKNKDLYLHMKAKVKLSNQNDITRYFNINYYEGENLDNCILTEQGDIVNTKIIKNNYKKPSLSRIFTSSNDYDVAFSHSAKEFQRIPFIDGKCQVILGISQNVSKDFGITERDLKVLTDFLTLEMDFDVTDNYNFLFTKQTQTNDVIQNIYKKSQSIKFSDFVEKPKIKIVVNTIPNRKEILPNIFNCNNANIRHFFIPSHLIKNGTISKKEWESTINDILQQHRLIDSWEPFSFKNYRICKEKIIVFIKQNYSCIINLNSVDELLSLNDDRLDKIGKLTELFREEATKLNLFLDKDTKYEKNGYGKIFIFWMKTQYQNDNEQTYSDLHIKQFFPLGKILPKGAMEKGSPGSIFLNDIAFSKFISNMHMQWDSELDLAGSSREINQPNDEDIQIKSNNRPLSHYLVDPKFISFNKEKRYQLESKLVKNLISDKFPQKEEVALQNDNIMSDNFKNEKYKLTTKKRSNN
ncbi:MAG: hypothetical protein Q8899_00060 [Weeping tea tree witches'-broom phytoplasma]|uniref:hypothetical protein n=1 Tax=Candidatus Phytoplasma melaleucae TaxID=2982630 RepID=UPI00293B4045|nr:hypothetical protein [Weeping tea tree witches'-broom phytoplasma]